MLTDASLRGYPPPLQVCTSTQSPKQAQPGCLLYRPPAHTATAPPFFPPYMCNCKPSRLGHSHCHHDEATATSCQNPHPYVYVHTTQNVHTLAYITAPHGPEGGGKTHAFVPEQQHTTPRYDDHASHHIQQYMNKLALPGAAQQSNAANAPFARLCREGTSALSPDTAVSCLCPWDVGTAARCSHFNTLRSVTPPPHPGDRLVCEPGACSAEQSLLADGQTHQGTWHSTPTRTTAQGCIKCTNEGLRVYNYLQLVCSDVSKGGKPATGLHG